MEACGDVSDLCKICLSSQRVLHSIETELSDGTTILQMLQSLFPNILTDDDNWHCATAAPKSICIRCRPRLELAYLFQQQLIASDTKIKKLLNVVRVEEVSVEETREVNQADLIEVVHVRYEIEEDKNLDTEPKGIEDVENLEEGLEVEDYDPPLDVDVDENPSDNYDDDSASESDTRQKTSGKKENPSNQKNYICHYCSKECTRYRMKEHLPACLRKQHRHKGEVLLKQWKLISKFKVDVHDRSTLRFICRYCDYQCTEEEDAKTHGPQHILTYKGKNLPCPICGKTLTNKYRLNRHMNTHEKEKKHPCDQCGKFFNDIYRLKQHLKRHSGVKPHACTYCSFRFVEKGDLTRHIRTHTREKPFTCDVCAKSYGTIGVLTLHKRIMHSRDDEVMRFICEFCEKRFHTKSQLASHRRTHTGEKPHACNHCDRRFADKTDLTKHQRVHFGPLIFDCPSCSEKFRTKTEVRQHMIVHAK